MASLSPFAIRPISTSSDVDCIACGRPAWRLVAGACKWVHGSATVLAGASNACDTQPIPGGKASEPQCGYSRGRCRQAQNVSEMLSLPVSGKKLCADTQRRGELAQGGEDREGGNASRFGIFRRNILY